MNKYQEALEFFTKLTNRVPLKFANDEFCEKYDKNLVLIKELVDKESPRKPHEKYYQIICGVDDTMNCIDYYCPSCGKKVVSDIVNYKEYRHCYHCGQKLDWSGEDENTH